jgi:hypothetical protein
MEFRTKLDFSSRQVKQNERTFANISGGTTFGVTFSALTTGPDLTTSGVTSSATSVVSTFSGNTGTTVFTWYDSRMNLANAYISAITNTTSGLTQTTGQVYTGNTTGSTDGNRYNLTYSGVSFDITPQICVSPSAGVFSGTVLTSSLRFLSAGTLDYTGRTIWADVSGITRTERLIITNLGAGPGTLDVGIDANGFLVNNASDISLKENVNTINDALNKVLNLRGVTYNWRDRNSGGDATKIGFIAQEVNQIVPELTHHDGKYMSVHYKDITALLVEAIKELVNGEVTINVNRESLNTQTVVAEDNNIELNYNGNHQTSIGGGIIVLHGISENNNSVFETDENGDWITNTNLKPEGLIIPVYTPSSSLDTNGVTGNITRDDDYLYLKTENGWKRINLESF